MNRMKNEDFFRQLIRLMYHLYKENENAITMFRSMIEEGIQKDKKKDTENNFWYQFCLWIDQNIHSQPKKLQKVLKEIKTDTIVDYLISTFEFLKTKDMQEKVRNRMRKVKKEEQTKI